MIFLHIANGVTALCIVAMYIAVVLNFLLNKKPRAFNERRSLVATGVMAAIFLLIYFTIRFRWGALPLQSTPFFLCIRSFGLLLMLGGTAFNLYGRLHLKSNWANHVRIYQDHSLITDGPYRWVRHPLYASIIWMFYGASIAYLSPLAALENALIFVPAMIYRARQEEDALQSAFGDAYTGYMQKTGRFFPLLRSFKNRRSVTS